MPSKSVHVVTDGKISFFFMAEYKKLKENNYREFLGGPAVRTLCLHCRGHGLYPWVGEPRSHKPQGAAKNKFLKVKTKIKKNIYCGLIQTNRTLVNPC